MPSQTRIRIRGFASISLLAACASPFRNEAVPATGGAPAETRGGAAGASGRTAPGGGVGGRQPPGRSGGDGGVSSGGDGRGASAGTPGSAATPGSGGKQGGGGASPDGVTSGGTTGGATMPQGGTNTAGSGGSGGAPAAGAGASTGGHAAFAGAAQGGRAGAAGSSGLAGSGGATGGAGFCTPPLVVDDMEDGDALTCPNQGRGGDWWTATGTPTGTIDPPTDEDFPAYALAGDARAGSKYGMRLSGTGFGHTDDDWASLGFFMAGESPYDLTPYSGLAFYAKSRTSSTELHVEFATVATTPASENGDCDTDCNDHYASILTVSTAWQEFRVDFDALAQEGWGPKPKDLPHTLFIYFGFLGTDGGPANFDFLIDDVRLY